MRTRARVKAVADNPASRARLEEVLAAGEKANASQAKADWREFLRLQASTQKQDQAVAELIHTPKPPAKGTQGDAHDTLAILDGENGGEIHARRTRIARAALHIQKYMATAVHEVEMTTLLKRANGERLASAVLFGTLLESLLPSGAFKIAELTADRKLATALPAGSVDASRVLVRTLEPIKRCFKWTHPRDDDWEDAIDRAVDASTGPIDDKEHHDVVFGEMWKHWARAWQQWREGMGNRMPVLVGAIEKTLRDPHVQYVIDGRAEAAREAQELKVEGARMATEVATLKSELVNAKRDLASAKRQPAPKPPKPDDAGKGTEQKRKEDTDLAGGVKPPSNNLIQGKARQAKHAELFAKIKEANAAKSAAEALESNSAPDASSKRAVADGIQAEVDAIKTATRPSFAAWEDGRQMYMRSIRV